MSTEQRSLNQEHIVDEPSFKALLAGSMKFIAAQADNEQGLPVFELLPPGGGSIDTVLFTSASGGREISAEPQLFLFAAAARAQDVASWTGVLRTAVSKKYSDVLHTTCQNPSVNKSWDKTMAVSRSIIAAKVATNMLVTDQNARPFQRAALHLSEESAEPPVREATRNFVKVFERTIAKNLLDTPTDAVRFKRAAHLIEPFIIANMLGDARDDIAVFRNPQLAAQASIAPIFDQWLAGHPQNDTEDMSARHAQHQVQQNRVYGGLYLQHVLRNFHQDPARDAVSVAKIQAHLFPLGAATRSFPLPQLVDLSNNIVSAKRNEDPVDPETRYLARTIVSQAELAIKRVLSVTIDPGDNSKTARQENGLHARVLQAILGQRAPAK